MRFYLGACNADNPPSQPKRMEDRRDFPCLHFCSHPDACNNAVQT